MVEGLSGAVMRVVVAALVSLCGASMARAETVDQLYDKAKLEQSLVFYSGGPVEPYQRWAKDNPR